MKHHKIKRKQKEFLKVLKKQYQTPIENIPQRYHPTVVVGGEFHE